MRSSKNKHIYSYGHSDKHIYSYGHSDKAVHENLLLVSTDRFGSDGSILLLVVTENLDFAYGEVHLLVRFSID